MSRAPFEQCPRFMDCSVNLCPLDPERDRRAAVSGEPKCPLGKTRRMRIAAQFPTLLPGRGLHATELAAVLAWEALSPEEREARRTALAERRMASGVGRNPTAPQDDLLPTAEDTGEEA